MVTARILKRWFLIIGLALAALALFGFMLPAVMRKLW